MNYRVAQTYNQVMYNRSYNEPAKQWWVDNVVIPVFKRDNYTCMKCGWVKPRYYTNKYLCCHHRTYKDAEGRSIIGREHLYLDRMITLCDECHNFVHGKLWYQMGKVPKTPYFTP